MRAPVAPKGWPSAIEPPVRLIFSGIDVADRLAASEFFLRDFLRAEPLDVRQHLRGEGFVHFDHADVFELDLRALERGREREDGALQQLIERIGRGVRVALDEAEGLDAERFRLVLGHEQHRGRAVGERGGVAGGDRAVLAVEDRLQLREIFERRVAANEVVALDDVLELRRHDDGHHFVLEPPALRRRRGALMALQREAVLRLAADGILLRHLLRRLAHGQAGRRLRDCRRIRREVFDLDALECAELSAHRFLFARRDQRLGEFFREEDRYVRQRFRAAGDDGVGVAARDHVRSGGDGLIRRRAGLADGVARDPARQPRAEDDFAGDVWRLDRRDDVAEDDFLHLGGIDAGALHELRHDELAEVERGEMCVMRSRFREGRSEAADHGDARGVLPGHKGGSIAERLKGSEAQRLKGNGGWMAASFEPLSL